MKKVKKETKTGVVVYTMAKNKKEVKFTSIAEDKSEATFAMPREVFEELNCEEVVVKPVEKKAATKKATK